MNINPHPEYLILKDLVLLVYYTCLTVLVKDSHYSTCFTYKIVIQPIQNCSSNRKCEQEVTSVFR
ncbi:hypothetical protein CDL12_04521 [Handroanthus impetiginosus]|uniref:Uncharacterized protein n=1 Tax=Handroanthus impetiginosus TaxID=429701 RepID=A0A2G9HZJ3_9LAMI|nr:hypothetical protein CDL12_04521 [Handroanthus impetiginosus]